MNQTPTFDVQGLEPRRLLTAFMDGNILVVAGTSAADRILVVSRDNGDTLRVTINGKRSYFNASLVDEIHAFGYRGSDDIEISNDIAIDAQIDGKQGNDTLLGGAGTDSIFGSTGHDRL